MAVLCVQAIVFLKVFLQLYCAKWGCVAACTPQMQLLALAFVFFIDFLMTVNISGKAHCRESMQVPVKAVSSVKGFSLLKDVCCIRAFMFSFFYFIYYYYFSISTSGAAVLHDLCHAILFFLLLRMGTGF